MSDAVRKAEQDVLRAAEKWARSYLKDDAMPADESSDLVAAVILWLQTKEPKKRKSSVRKKFAFPDEELSPAELRELGFEEDDIPTSPGILIGYKE